MQYRDGTLSYDTNAVSVESGLACLDPSLADQSAKEEADINTIVRRFGLTGQLPEGVAVPQLDMFVDVFDYNSAMLAIRKAQESFDAMPAEVRARFQNDPAQFVDFCADVNNLDEMRKLGLAVPKEEAAVETAPPEVVK